MPGKILVVDDTPLNVKMLADLLSFKGYQTATAASGAEALRKIEDEHPDLVLLDVMMPGMNGYEVCQKIRENPATGMLPVVMVTALDPAQERVKGIEAGADDFLSKPINQPELLARVRSLLRIKELWDTVQSQASQLAEWNKTLEQRVQEQVSQLDRLGRLKNFFSPQLAESIVNGGGEDLLKTHRREVVVVFLDMRGFTAFTDSSEPEEVMNVLNEYHKVMGPLIMEHEGTLERFAGDGMMIFFNDPIKLENPVLNAVTMAIAMQVKFAPLRAAWKKRGFDLDLGIGFVQGYATLGAIGYEGRWDYACIGGVSNLAARLCSEAKGGQILTNPKTLARIEDAVNAEPLGEVTLKGIAHPVAAFNITGAK
ncbi:MAG: adenylate/guanylate cyclase [Betaproteobacteria bacterium]|nr:adenylate/guanylate cyclase [Betaproteobacteria bacterium]